MTGHGSLFERKSTSPGYILATTVSKPNLSGCPAIQPQNANTQALEGVRNNDGGYFPGHVRCHARLGTLPSTCRLSCRILECEADGKLPIHSSGMISFRSICREASDAMESTGSGSGSGMAH